MAITTKAITRGGRKTGYASWAVNFRSADGSGGEIIKADPGAGYALCVEYLMINCAADDAVSIREDTTLLLGPYTFKVAGPAPIVLRFSKNPNDLMEGAMVLSENTELQVLTAGAVEVAGYVEGHTIEV